MTKKRDYRPFLYGGASLSVAIGLLAWVLAPSQLEETLAQTVDPAQIVDQFFPQALIDRATAVGLEVDPDFCFVVFDTLPSGEPKTIMAAYAAGGIRVIQEQGDGTYGVIFEPSGFLFGGLKCRVGLVDLDADGRNEVTVSFTDMRIFTGDWYFRWDGVQLINLGPTQGDERKLTILSTTGTLDLDHDGIMEILSLGDSSLLTDDEGFVPSSPIKVYRSQGGPYQFDRTLLSVRMFVRDKGEPQTETAFLNFPSALVGEFVLKVINGDHDGSKRVASARIVLNGEEVLSPLHFSQQVEFLTIPVALVRHNRIEVTLDGKPLGRLTVTVEDISPGTP